MKIYSIVSQKSYYSKFMDVCLINKKQPFQIEFFSRDSKSEKAKNIADISIFSIYPDLDLNLHGEVRLFSQRAVQLLSPFIALNKLKYNLFFYEQIPFYAFNAPRIIPKNISDEYISENISLAIAIKKYLTPDTHYFQPSSRFLIYTTEQFRRHVIENKITGIDFQLEWEDAFSE